MPNPIINRRLNGYRVYDPVIMNWLTRCPVKPSSSYLSSLNTMVSGMRADGNLTEIDFLQIGATELQSQAQVPIITTSGNNITEVNSPTWTALQGYTGNGTTMYLDLNWNPATHGIKFTQNIATHGAYVRTDSAAGLKIEMGSRSGSAYFNSIIAKGSGGVALCSVNSVLAGATGAANSDARGMYSGKRTASTNFDTYKNGAVHDNDVNTSTTIYNGNIYGLARNWDGAPDSYTDRQLSMFYCGGAINVATFYSRFQTFATEIGFNV